MSSRIIIWLLCSGALALACGPRSKSDAATSTPGAPADSARAQAGATPTDSATRDSLATSLAVTVRDGVRFALSVTNTSASRLELDFPSGQLYDFAVLDSVGREIWRWSTERMFTQALQNRYLASGETLSFAERWNGKAPAGRYTAVATLTSSNYPLEKRVAFTIP